MLSSVKRDTAVPYAWATLSPFWLHMETLCPLCLGDTVTNNERIYTVLWQHQEMLSPSVSRDGVYFHALFHGRDEIDV